MVSASAAVASAALGVEGDRGDPAAAHGQRETGHVAACGAARGAGEGVVGHGATARLIAKEVVEELRVHWMKGTE